MDAGALLTIAVNASHELEVDKVQILRILQALWTDVVWRERQGHQQIDSVPLRVQMQ